MVGTKKKNLLVRVARQCGVLMMIVLMTSLVGSHNNNGLVALAFSVSRLSNGCRVVVAPLSASSSSLSAEGSAAQGNAVIAADNDENDEYHGTR